MMVENRTLELESCTIAFKEGDVVHTHFKDGRIVSKEEVQQMFDAIAAERQGRKVLLVVSVGEGTTMSNDARAHASAPESNRYIAADAIVVRDFGHQLAANVFVRHHKPTRPIRMFPDMQSALDWLHHQHHLIDQA
jgi:hypothetical protein